MKKQAKIIKLKHLDLLYKKLEQIQLVIEDEEKEFRNKYAPYCRGQYVSVHYKEDSVGHNSIRTEVALIKNVKYRHDGYKSGFNIEVQPYKKDFSGKKAKQYSYWLNLEDSYRIQLIK